MALLRCVQKAKTLIPVFSTKSYAFPNIHQVRNVVVDGKDLYEPDYLISLEPDVPVYDCLNIQIKSYDFTVLENYQKYVHRYAKILNLDIDDGWPTPAQTFKIQRFKPQSTIVESEYALNLYERNIQVSDVPAPMYSVLLRVLQETLPEGVSLSVHEALEEHQELRYVPDNQLLELKQQLDGMGGPKKKKNQ